jgi:glycosyltransferase involved in cell wall biosynthesis
MLEENREYEDLLHIVDTIQPDIIWLGYGNISYPLLKYIKKKTDRPVVCDTDSVWSRFVLRGMPYAKNEAERTRIQTEGTEKEEEERRGTQLADVTTAVSEVDAAYYRSLVTDKERIKIFSNVIDLDDYRSLPDQPPNFRKPCMYLAGTFGAGSSMEEAARWIIRDVLPIVKSRIPDIHLYIIGNRSDETLQDIRDPSITITGRLPSVLPYLGHADVSIVPLKFESGTRFKILEAGACGIPVVSTTLGAEGIPVTNGLDILIADDPAGFAEYIISLITDPDYARTIGMRLHALIEEKFGIPTLISEGNVIINALLDK